jgi:hypothetical protein
MNETPKSNSIFKTTWRSPLFVSAVFVVVWLMAVLRLYRHEQGELFPRWWLFQDRLIVILAPVAIALRLWQTKKAHER